MPLAVTEIPTTVVILVLFVAFGLLGGQMAKNGGRSYWLGFAIGLFGSIVGLLIVAYINKTPHKRTFEPNFTDHTTNQTAAINTLAALNDQNKLSDQEFKRLKKKIIE